MAAQDLTIGSIPRLLIRLGLPVLASYALQSMYHLADLYFVGRLGGASIAGLAIAANTFFVTLALGMTFGTGALALISQAYGRGARAEIPVLLQQTLWMALAAGLALWLLGALGAARYVALFTDDPAVLAEGTAYFRLFAATMLTGLLSMVVIQCFRAVGDFITPTLMLALGVGLNLVLDPVLIFGLGPVPALGVRGAALATVISQVAVVLALARLVVGRRAMGQPGAVLVLHRPFILDRARMWRMLRIGLPAGGQFLLFALTLFITYRVVRPFGAEATAATGVGFRLLETCVLPIVSVGAAVSSLTGQNFGARRYDRVRAAALWGLAFATGIAVLEVALLAAAPRFWVGLFTADPGVREIGAQYLLIGGLGVLLLGPSHLVVAVGLGLGRTLLPLLSQGLRLAGLLTGLTLLVGAWDWGMPGVFWARALSQVPEALFLAGVLAYWWRTVLRQP